MFKKISKTVFLMACMVSFMPGNAMAGWIISQSAAVEADSVKVIKDKHKKEAFTTVLADGCEGCPLELKTDENTRYFLDGKQIKGKKVDALSGQAGTVIYDADKALTIRVRW